MSIKAPPTVSHSSTITLLNTPSPQMQFPTLIVLCFSFFILQLAHATQGMDMITRGMDMFRIRINPAFDLAGSSSFSTVEAPFNLKYWISPIESLGVRGQLLDFLQLCVEFKGPGRELETKKEPENADLETHLSAALFSPNFLVGPFGSCSPAVIDYYGRVDIKWEALDDNDPRRLFIQHMRDEKFDPEYAAYLIQFGFKGVLHNRLATDEEVKEWLKILAYTLRQASHARSGVVSHLAVSASYGLLSLELRYRNLERHLPDIVAMRGFVRHIQQVITIFGAKCLRWEHEYIFPGFFGKEIIDLDNFMQIIKLDEHLENAMFSPTPENGWKDLKTLCEEFGSSSAHRRLVTMAIFYHKFKDHGDNQEFRGLFRSISRSRLFHHEQALVGFVTNSSKNSQTTRLLPSK
ncbi:hypothetical protein PTTG_27073 [Puccinia triticina 1-1 BBBD Race 1]|uniref:Uncharacterized protein n=1 Tax=Puccinia triticina (isolate 1-1 / race 1 (BBBD)) TaxID=630390 RepID=A0A180GN38_PUCT1|nr:hypothetical protein PTTG_27073 [Puccinia triticina 1-1 BBBD Race 1]